MRNKLLMLNIIIMMFLLVGCGSDEEEKSTTSGKQVKDNETGMYDMLTEDQRKYLTETQYMTEDGINKMEYEAVNWELLGTGLELYNPSSGVEKFGLSYEEAEPINEESTSNELITLEKVIEIRNKETNMRLNDFSEYKYSIEQYDKKNGMYVPIKDYEDTYIVIAYTRDDSGNINMQVPYIKHEKGDTDYTFSILYDKETMRQYYEESPKYDLGGKKYIEIQHTSVTEKSLVLELYNWTEKEYKLVANYEIYEINDSGKSLLTSFEGEKRDIRSNSYSIEGISLNEGVKLEDGKKYLIKFGINKDGYFYDEIEFVK